MDDGGLNTANIRPYYSFFIHHVSGPVVCLVYSNVCLASAGFYFKRSGIVVPMDFLFWIFNENEL